MAKPDKFSALVHYICWRCQDPTKLGAIKLNKVLWFSDAIAFAQSGRSITGAKYIKRQFGPVPQKILQALERLERDHKLAVRERDYHGRTKREYFALEPPEISAFSAEEISLVDSVIDAVCDHHTATSISELTHDDAWQLARIGEEIPLHAFLAAESGELTEESLAWAKSEATRLGYGE